MKKTPIAILLSTAFICSSAICSVNAATLIHAGKIITAENGKILTDHTIVVEQDKISALEAGFRQANADDTVIDLKQHTVMPGLMDMHTHFYTQFSPSVYSEGFTMNEADYALRGATFAEKTLMAGFTTVRELGDNNQISVALKKAIAKGYIKGPRIYAAGKSIATTGGHADPTNGLAYALMADPGPKEGVINGPDDARKAVRQRYKEGSDLIKITATGGVLSVAKSGSNPQFTDEELAAIVSTAKDYGMKVAVHAHGKEGMERAIRAGVDSIEHGTYMDKNTMSMMRKQGTYFVPTISAGKWAEEKSHIAGFFPDLVRPKAATIGGKIQQTFAEAYKAGVKIAFGTDAGVYEHGNNWREFIYMTEAGMPALEAIHSATIEGARLLGVADELGSIKAGKLADIVAVQGDPLQDINLMGQISFVMKAGQIFRQ
ncbi:MAG: amidohydrolase [Alteromonadaceae bacterium]|jgi:imidazolonepropionase-like amidohydrolase|uniref:Amidohydrolase family protein n=3 Tax=Rheinheimera TaxID=67575 RepID=A0ABP3PFC0_9GAMM|nr:amidohydrolase family protein [Rheinheimera aquimaris]MBJ92173.1 amidohydrolase [Alteromonadaceae bacterium]MCB5215606.1 amidohydrolase family protein [Rheinheimera aquimaris]MCD1599668.1 amidohydrolase family protein [Rheinheimera aquimaris]|tara:strand:- start:2417 stop:3712 length:1296 start_codon:yes stop_codon:yes gene_type:complete